MATAVGSMLFCLLVLVFSPYVCFSYHHSYIHDGKHFVLRSNDDPKQPESMPCSAIHAGRSGKDGLPVLHRSNPCSGIGGDVKTLDEPSTAEDVHRRDAIRMFSLFGEGSPSTSGAPAPAPSPSSGVEPVPIRGDPNRSLPGALEYHVTAGFGTPVQKFPVGFDTATGGATLLRCKPCATYPEPCGDSFDPSASSSLAHVPCGSPDCPLNCSGPSCSRSLRMNGTFLGNEEFVTDTLTLSPSTTIENFRFACLEDGLQTVDSSSGILDLSRNSHSLASRAPNSLFTVAFSYCLPSSKADVGFLYIGDIRSELFGYNMSYTPFRSNGPDGNLYIVDLVGIGVGGGSLPIPPTTLAGDSLLDVHTTFTYLKPEVYTVLRDNFRKHMSQYRVAPPRGELDTCYDFTGVNVIVMPIITLQFAGGAASLELLIEEMMYFSEPGNIFSVGCLAFAPARANARFVSLIGNKAQATTKVVYDLRGRQVGFVPHRC